MSTEIRNDVPKYSVLIEATFSALKELGGSGKNDEINQQAIQILNISDSVLEILHTNTNMTEVAYRLAWARTLLKKYGAIVNSSRGVWSISASHSAVDSINGIVVERCKNRRGSSVSGEMSSPSTEAELNLSESELEEASVNSDLPDEIRPWRTHLHDVLLKMNPYAFERLSQRLLREYGFSQVTVTKKSGDGGIDGRGKWKMNGIFSFNIAFQCKRYQGSVGSADIRDFRGSLTTDIEKAVFITTGAFSKPAIDEATTSGKQQIDLIDGDDFMDMLAKLQLGVKEVIDYQIDDDFFFNM